MTALRAILAAAMIVAAAAPSAQADFGLKDVDVTYTQANGDPVVLAGTHPYALTTDLAVNTKITPDGEFPDEELKDLEIELPTGLVGVQTPVPPCPAMIFAQMSNPQNGINCPASSVIGIANVTVSFGALAPNSLIKAPVINLEAPFGAASKIGFAVASELVTVETSVTENPPYRLVTRATNSPNVAQFYGAEVTLWGVPASPVHDSERILCGKPSCPVELPEIPFLTMPRSCTGPLVASFRADSWLNPGVWSDPLVSESHDNEEPPQPYGLEGCSELGFSPEIDAGTSTSAAASPTGLTFDMAIDDLGMTEVDGVVDSDVKKMVVTLPEGMTTNPAVASGLEACTLAEFEAEAPQPGEGCPQASKIGSVEAETPLLEDKVLEGSIYVAKQHDNPFDNLLAIYAVINDPKLGLAVGLPGKVDPDPQTGRLTSTFDDLPQVPLSHVRVHLRDGERAPLITPPTCGAFEVEADLYPYSDPGAALHRTADLVVNAGAGGGACSSAEDQLPNSPSFTAGTLQPAAGSFSPFVLRLARKDGTQEFSSISATLPEGLLGKLAGIPYCQEAQIEAAAARSQEGEGALEQVSPSCPAASEVGTVDVAVGAGSQLLHVPGRIYLAGPYKGAPISFAIVTPAIAGPFDFGVVVARTASYVDPSTAEVRAVSDPLPTILHGLPLHVRAINVDLARPDFMLNPTSCEPKSIFANITSTLGSVAPLSEYFQAGDCRKLKFTPKIAIGLKGDPRRSGHPALHAVLTNPGKTANLSRAVATLPGSMFIDPLHISNPCTRVQFDAEECPAGSVLGRVRAFTPLLDDPLEGRLIFRSNGGDRELPDIVADLRGQIRAVVVGFVDSVTKKGSERSRVRTTFAHIPDAPVSKIVIDLYGGKRGLLVNSTNLCRRPQVAALKLVAQNGRQSELRPRVATSCSKKHRTQKRR